MSAEIVQDDLYLNVFAVFGDDIVDEIKELSSPSALVMSSFHHTGSHFQCRKQRGGTVALRFVRLAGNSFTIGQPQPALSSLQCLNMRLFVHAHHHGILGRVQIQANYVCGFRGKLRIIAFAPAFGLVQINFQSAQNAPHLIGKDTLTSSGECAALTFVFSWL